MWVSMKEMSGLVKPGRFALGAFHAANLEQAQGILEAAVEHRSPVIIALSEPAAIYAGIGAFLALAQELSREVPAPVSLLLDHVHDPDLISQALGLGVPGLVVEFTEPGDRRIELFSEVRAQCQAHGAFFEAVIRCSGGGGEEALDLAGRLMGEAAPDSICLSLARDGGLSSAEGEEAREEAVKLIEQMKRFTEIPMSLAGAGFWPEDAVKQAIGLGVWKLSVGTRLNVAFTEGLKSALSAHPGRVHPRSYLAEARESLGREVKECIRVFGSWEEAPRS